MRPWPSRLAFIHITLGRHSNDVWMIDVLTVKKGENGSKNKLHDRPCMIQFLLICITWLHFLKWSSGRTSMWTSSVTAFLNTITFLWDVLDIPSWWKVVMYGKQQALVLITDTRRVTVVQSYPAQSRGWSHQQKLRWLWLFWSHKNHCARKG